MSETMKPGAFAELLDGSRAAAAAALGQWLDAWCEVNGIVEVELVVGEEPEEGVEVEVWPRCNVQVNGYGCSGAPGHYGNHACVESRP